MSRDSLDAALGKWRAHWPEWAIAELFLPLSRRETAVAWFALLDEWGQAAWGGAEPAPGLAKLAWWQEELRGWSKGARRHPLGMALQSQPVDWAGLADALPSLRDRDALVGDATALQALLPFARAAAAAEAGLFGEPAADPSRLARTMRMSTGVPLLGTQPEGPAGPMPRRVIDALASLRMASSANGRAPSRWQVPWVAWRAARSR